MNDYVHTVSGKFENGVSKEKNVYEKLTPLLAQHYSDWVCTAVMSNDVMKDLRG